MRELQIGRDFKQCKLKDIYIHVDLPCSFEILLMEVKVKLLFDFVCTMDWFLRLNLSKVKHHLAHFISNLCKVSKHLVCSSSAIRIFTLPCISICSLKMHKWWWKHLSGLKNAWEYLSIMTCDTHLHCHSWLVGSYHIIELTFVERSNFLIILENKQHHTSPYIFFASIKRPITCIGLSKLHIISISSMNTAGNYKKLFTKVSDEDGTRASSQGLHNNYYESWW